ncbi:MAG: cob(I)yrinic acid a,c-diamide adenosyltransferase, partial [Planctomycetaceae bacterium]|nr:cob(I)yrinic acid a,c-diamide adenosyltransferase [Planctomycetaceae bacterium]
MDHEGDEQHRRRMTRLKEAHEAQLAKATREKGLILVHTGAGKGKSSAAFGLVARALGQGMRVGIIQFIKGAIATGEAAFFGQLGPQVTMKTLGEGFTWDTQDRRLDIDTAQLGWQEAVAMLRDPTYDLVVLDELNIVLHYNYLPLGDVLDELRRKREMLHVVITGRNARPELIELADLVTEMKLIKHPYRSGVMP